MSRKFHAPVPSGVIRAIRRRSLALFLRMRQIAVDIVHYQMIVSLSSHGKEVSSMKMVRLLIQVPEPIKARLDALRQGGTTASGFIRHLLEDHFKQASAMGRKGR